MDPGLSHSIATQAMQSSGWTAAVVMAPVGMVVIEIDRVGRIAAMVMPLSRGTNIARAVGCAVVVAD